MTPPLDQYISPHAQQGIIAGVFIAFGWMVAARQNRRRDAQLRDERSKDIQRALLAEIRAHVATLEQQRMDAAALRAVLDQMRMRGHAPLIPAQANDRIYVTILTEVHLLPEYIIDPVVTYYRRIAVMNAFADAIQKLTDQDGDRMVAMFADYLELTDDVREVGLWATQLLMASVFGGGEEAVRELIERERQKQLAQIAATLPFELAGLRDRLNRQSSARSGL